MNWHSKATPLLVLLALVALAYWPAIDCGFIWDDDDYVTQNPVLRTWGGILSVWFEPTSLPQYYPLVHTTFWLEYRLWGPEPAGYHVVNLLLHFLACCGLLALLRRLAVPGAFFAAALFAVHPVMVESVAWVTERKNVLSLLCAVLAANAWLGWRDGDRAMRSRGWMLATLWFVFALLSKTVTASTPGALLVIQWWRHGRLERRDWLGLLPWIGLGLFFGLLTAWLEATHVGAGGEAWQLQGGERLLVAGRAPWFYLSTLLWPAGLCFNYARWELDTSSFMQWLPVVGTVATVVVLVLLRNRIGRGPAAVVLLFGGMLVPALGFFDVYPFRFSYVADHFQYHAATAMLAGIAAGLTLVVGRTRLTAPVRLAAAGLVLLPLGVLTNLHTRNYRDLETLWRATLDTQPDSALATINLAGLLMNEQQLDEAEAMYHRSLELMPDSHEAFANLAVIAHQRRDLAEAERLYERTLALRRKQPITLVNYGHWHLEQGQNRAAFDLAREALDLNPDLMQGHRLRLTAGVRIGRWSDAVASADYILKRLPADLDVRVAAAEALAGSGNHESAIQNAHAALQRQPENDRARRVFVAALAVILSKRPAAGAASEARRMCASGKLDAEPMLPALAAELRRIGALAHAEVVARAAGG